MKKAHKENSQVLCEENYRRLMQMFPEAEFFDHLALKSKNQPVTLAIDVIERTPYTVLITLTLGYTACSMFAPETVMQVRVYHDASVAEVIQFQGHQRIRSHYTYPNSLMYLPDEKWQCNKLLSDILDFCHNNQYKKALLAAEV